MAHDELFQGLPPPVPENPSHGDILAGVRRLETTIATLIMTQQREAVASKATAEAVARLEKRVGWIGHDQHGSLIGEGFLGDFARLDEKVTRRFNVQDGWRRYMAGALFATTLLVVVVWWLVEGKLAAVLR